MKSSVFLIWLIARRRCPTRLLGKFWRSNRAKFHQFQQVSEQLGRVREQPQYLLDNLSVFNARYDLYGAAFRIATHFSNCSISMAIHVVRKEGLEMTGGQLYS